MIITLVPATEPRQKTIFHALFFVHYPKIILYNTKIILSCFLILFSFSLNAQVTDNTSSFKNTGSKKYFRLHYDNDYFTKSDEYYTQGISLEYVHRGIQRFPLTKLLIRPRQKAIIYGITIDHYGFTPTSILSDSILYNDRPFSSNLSLQTFLIATGNKQRISVGLTTGIMGPAAGGKAMQTDIHRWLKNPLPHGWQYQVKNDVILNYHVKYEQQLVKAGTAFLLNGVADLQIGTHNDNLGAGLNFMAGHFNSPYIHTKNNRVSYYVYAQSKLNAIAYDATLQGGLFNRSSPYTIAEKNISRLTFRGDYGLVVSFGKLYLEYCQSILTKEFNTGKLHRWGGIRVGLIF